ncbi:MAG: c-type cytochrome biogenesis protein CcmI [Alphaproteobacteria bacterium]
MILFWLAAGLIAAAVVAAIARPLMAPRPPAPEARLDFDLQIYRDQLAEIARAEAAGEVSAAEAAAARTEIERRALAAADREEATPARPGLSRAVAIAMLAAMPVGAMALYGWHGAPGLPGQPLAGRPAAPSAQVAADDAIRSVARRLEERPDDVALWEQLGRLLVQAERWTDAVDAYRHAIGVAGERPDLQAGLGEALTYAAGGVVTPAAAEAFRKAPDDPRARFFLAEAAAQAGDLAGALDAFLAFERDSAADAPWRRIVRQRIAELAGALGRPVPEAASPAARGPAEGLMALPPEERARAIRGMVEGLAGRLEAAPDDKDGWRRLARSWGVLGEHDKAAAALARAIERFPGDVELRLDRAAAQLEAAGGDATLPPAFMETIRGAAALAPDHPQVLWYLGRAAAEGGDPAEARRLWRRLLERLPEDAPVRAEVERRLAALP